MVHLPVLQTELYENVEMPAPGAWLWPHSPGVAVLGFFPEVPEDRSHWADHL